MMGLDAQITHLSTSRVESLPGCPTHVFIDTPSRLPPLVVHHGDPWECVIQKRRSAPSNTSQGDITATRNLNPPACRSVSAPRSRV